MNLRRNGMHAYGGMSLAVSKGASEKPFRSEVTDCGSYHNANSCVNKKAVTNELHDAGETRNATGKCEHEKAVRKVLREEGKMLNVHDGCANEKVAKKGVFVLRVMLSVTKCCAIHRPECLEQPRGIASQNPVTWCFGLCL
ncbi:unnamed protein product [Haemonchus placei]|uniref:Uncharacterized protein n=1 Tax=Haemonchus placei TaxID=6290 RepID=A0A0N4WQR2_HAEPC|nr:unnamed protein product [Haemonchus placei]